MTLKSTNKNAKIYIHSTQLADGDENVIKQTVTGAFYEKSGNFYLLYREPDAETGKDGDSVMLRVTGQAVVMRRSGAACTEMRFETGKKDVFLYRMPYGTMNMEIDCRQAEVVFAESGGAVTLDYMLRIGDACYENHLMIQVEVGGGYI